MSYSHTISKLPPIFKFSLMILLCLTLLTKEINTLNTKEIIDSVDYHAEIFDRLSYYRDYITKYELPLTIEINHENRLVVKNSKDTILTGSFNVQKQMIINSCDFFPYYDDLYQAFHINKPQLVIEDFSHSVFLTFKIMYFLYADQKFASELYGEEYYSGELIDNYCKTIPKGNERTIFSLNQDDITLAKKLNISMKYRELYTQIYDKIIENIKNNPDIEKKKVNIKFFFY